MAAISLRPVWFLVFTGFLKFGWGWWGSGVDCTEEAAPRGPGDLCSLDWVDSEFTSRRSVGGRGGVGGGGGAVLVFGSTRCFSPLASVSLYCGLLAVSVVLPEPGSYDRDALL